jgi:hypothetical protein
MAWTRSHHARFIRYYYNSQVRYVCTIIWTTDCDSLMDSMCPRFAAKGPSETGCTFLIAAKDPNVILPKRSWLICIYIYIYIYILESG